LIAAEKTNFPVAVMCRVLGVSRTGFHSWERRAPSDRALQDAWLTEKIKQVHDGSRAVNGAPRIHAELRLEYGIHVGRKRVARLMKAAGISGVRPQKRFKTTIRIPGITPATDLVERAKSHDRSIERSRPRRARQYRFDCCRRDGSVRPPRSGDQR
jgi:putative transposase